jgi:hypothetical protein
MKYKCSKVLFISSLLMFFSSCEKKDVVLDSSTGDSDVTTAIDNSLAEGLFNDAESIADQASQGQLTFFLPVFDKDIEKLNGEVKNVYEKSNCATVYHDTSSSPKVLTIDFGSVNCLCNDGRNRRGEVIVSYEGRYRDTNSMHTISFNDYYVNDNQVLGTKTVLNNGLNSDGKINFSIEVDGSIVKSNSTDTIVWVSSRTRTWEEGHSTTFNWLDDVYTITGNASGVNSAGISYTINITSPLRMALNCRWISSGAIEVKPEGKLKRLVDYGAGSCDASATITIAGISFPIVLP